MVSVGGASMDEFQDLLDDLRTVEAVASLPEVKQRQLTMLILEALASYRANRLVRGVWHPVVASKGVVAGQANLAPRGRPTKSENPHFLEDCVAAWEAVTGQRVLLWYNDANDSASVTLEIADAALGGRGAHVGVSGFKKWARTASAVRRKSADLQG